MSSLIYLTLLSHIAGIVNDKGAIGPQKMESSWSNVSIGGGSDLRGEDAGGSAGITTRIRNSRQEICR
jgi:hypothetical protein